MMRFQSLLPCLRPWFEEYIGRFYSDDPVIQKNIHLKAGHTHRVCEATVTIGKSLDLSMEDLCLAETAALLHDIGRFEQYRRYMTFSDSKSEDHAALGVNIIQSNRILHDLDPAEANLILRVIGYHNRITLPADEEDQCLFFLKLLRDADKIDIWQVVTDYYQNAARDRNQSIELDLPDDAHISDRVYETLINGNVVHMSDLNTLNDFKLLQIGWIYDVNFLKTFQIIQERKYLEKIRDVLPRSSTRVQQIYDRAYAHLIQHVSSPP